MNDEEERAMPPLSMVAPERWSEARRRADVLRRYLLIPAPSMAQTASFAASLGLGRTQFRTLARSFSAQEAAPNSAERHHASIGAASEAEIDAALRRLGPGVRQDDLRAVVAAVCARKGIPAPSVSTVRRRLIEARAMRSMSGSRSGETVLDHVGLDVLCSRDGLLARPSLVAALDAGNAEILAYDIDVGAALDFQAARALVAAQLTRDVEEALLTSRDPTRWCPSGRRLLSDRLGARIGRVPVIVSGHARRADAAPPEVKLDDLRLAIGQALDHSLPDRPSERRPICGA